MSFVDAVAVDIVVDDAVVFVFVVDADAFDVVVVFVFVVDADVVDDVVIVVVVIVVFVIVVLNGLFCRARL